jgi:prepilin-type N-terminal cleavage/methylation domain-containing protein
MNRAFTLIELLVVIGIIAVIAALLFPAFAAGKKSSKGTVCLENIHHIIVAAALYGADNNDSLPYAPDASTKSIIAGGGTVFGDFRDQAASHLPDVTHLLATYHLPAETWRCPLDRNVLFELEPGHKPTWFEEFGSSYGFDDKDALRSLAFSQFAEPSKKDIFSDESAVHGPTGVSGLSLFRNVAFADLHCKATTSEALVGAN